MPSLMPMGLSPVLPALARLAWTCRTRASGATTPCWSPSPTPRNLCPCSTAPAVALCRRAGFLKITFRGDTDFSQTTHLDGWDRQGIRFVFGIDAMPNLVEKAQTL